MRRLIFVIAIAVVGYAAPAAAQATDTIKQNTLFRVAADHDGVDTDSFRLYQNGVVVTTKPVTALAANAIVFDYLTGLPKGTYVFFIEAVGPGGVTGSDTLTLTVTPGAPKKPANIRIVKSAPAP